MVEETPMFRKIVDVLDAADVKYSLSTHERVHTSQDAASVRGSDLSSGAKAIVLEVRGKASMLLQCIVRGNRRIDLKKLKQVIGEKNISLAHPDKVFAATTCTIGSVPPFGNLFDPPIIVYVDKQLLDNELMVFSAGSHYHSIELRTSDWVQIVKPIVVDVGKDE